MARYDMTIIGEGSGGLTAARVPIPSPPALPTDPGFAQSLGFLGGRRLG